MGTQRGNLNQLSVTMGRMTCFILRPTQEPVLATSNTGKTRERFWKNAGVWTRGVEISKKEIPGSMRSMHGYILTCSRLKRGGPLSSGFSTDGSLIHASAVPDCGGSEFRDVAVQTRSHIGDRYVFVLNVTIKTHP